MAHRIAEKTVKRPALRVLHRGVAMVPDYRAQKDTRTRRYHGLVFDPTLGPEDEFTRESGEKYRAHHGGFVKQVDAVAVIPADAEHYEEYLKHLREGDLWAADAATAAEARVPFEPEFGGEHPETTAGEECQAALKVIKERTERGVAEAKKAEAAAKKKVDDAAKAPASATSSQAESGK